MVIFSEVMQKDSFWAPRLHTESARSKPTRELKDVPLPLVSEYFESSMRILDLIRRDLPNFSDADALSYVGYVRWILRLSLNHTWESVMAYDEAFRAQIEIDGNIKWGPPS